MIIDQPGKYSYTNFTSRNSKYRAKFGYSYNFKDMSYKLLSYKEYKLKLLKRIDNDSYNAYLN